MSGTVEVRMGDRGRVVIPHEMRSRLGLLPGVPLILIETPGGLLMTSVDQLKQLVRGQLSGADLVTELLAERRRQASAEDAA